jgi:hypothetical protein
VITCIAAIACQGLDKDLHAAAEAQDKMQGRFLLDIVIGQGPPILKLLAGEDQPLLIRWDAFLVLGPSHTCVGSN